MSPPLRTIQDQMALKDALVMVYSKPLVPTIVALPLMIKIKESV